MGSDVSIKDISKIVLRFADLHEAFDKSANWGIHVAIDKSGTSLSKLKLTLNWLNVYEAVIAEEAALYHWQLKVTDFGEASSSCVSIATATAQHHKEFEPSKVGQNSSTGTK